MVLCKHRVKTNVYFIITDYCFSFDIVGMDGRYGMVISDTASGSEI